MPIISLGSSPWMRTAAGSAAHMGTSELPPPGGKLQVDAVVHRGADLGGMDDLLPQHKERPGVAADEIKFPVLQVEGLVRQQLERLAGGFRRLGAGQGFGGGGGLAQGEPPPPHIELVFGVGLAAEQRQGVGGAVHQDGIAQFPPGPRTAAPVSHSVGKFLQR